MHVLLVEDDELVASGLIAGLELHGFVIDWMSSIRQAQHAMAHFASDVVILDLGLSDGDGLSVLGRWRAEGNDVPVLILTARDAVSDRVLGLETGADDYVLKPFELDELAARLYALARRAAGRSVTEMVHGDLVVRPSTKEVLLGDCAISLSRRELNLLEKFLNARGAVLSEDQLKNGLYGMQADVVSNTLNVHIYHLRRKLGRDVIETVRGVGFRLGPPLNCHEKPSR